MRTHMEFVTKISKHCNLRCTYCYEYNELANTRRMPLDNIQCMFRNLKPYCSAHLERISFIWHGGEPLLIKPAYYRQIGDLQRQILGEEVACWNVTQTNLTVLTDDLLKFLGRQEFFLGCGVSVDPFGNERVDTKGSYATTRFSPTCSG